jgi:AraC-like DNA-binding protein/mannose-6-phosphate isomerase-like protein (cupin superfamily)
MVICENSQDEVVISDVLEHSNTHYDIWRSDYINGLEIIESNIHGRSYPHHLHEALEIIWVNSGSARIICRGKVSTIEQGEACIIALNEYHGGGFYGKSNIQFTLIHIPPDIIHYFLQQSWHNFNSIIHLQPIKIISSACAKRINQKLINNLKMCSAQKQMRFATQSLKELLVAQPLQRSRVFSKRPSHPAIDRIRTILRSNYAEQINVEKLADEVCLNERYLISLFKCITGITPHQFQIGIRVDHARRLIHSDSSLSTAAATAGFADQSHFNRYFKRQYGMTPGAFRRIGELT